MSAYISREDFLFCFSSRDRGEEINVLYNLGGEDIWVYNPLSVKLFHKMDVDKYDPLLATNFSFIDLSSADYQANYTARISGSAFIKGQDAYKLILTPILKKGEYGQLLMFVSRQGYIPLRIDFQDRDKVVVKTLSIVEVASRGKRMFPVRYDMLDIKKGTLSILKYTDFDENYSIDPSMFRHENMGPQKVMPQYFVSESALQGDVFCVTGDDFYHLSRVRRAHAGQRIRITCGGRFYEAKIIRVCRR